MTVHVHGMAIATKCGRTLAQMFTGQPSSAGMHNSGAALINGHLAGTAVHTTCTESILILTRVCNGIRRCTPELNVFCHCCHAMAAAKQLECAECTGNPSPVPANSNFACPSPLDPGDVCSGTCAQGYTGSPQATCQAGGTYSAVAGSCTLIRKSS